MSIPNQIVVKPSFTERTLKAKVSFRGGSPMTVDTDLSISSPNPVQNKVITAAIQNRLWSDEVKQAMLQLAQKVAYIDDQGQTYYDALYNALYPPINLDSITAVFDAGGATIYNSMTLDDLKQYLTVTAYMTDGTTEVVPNYTLSGSMAAGDQTITVSYGGKTTTFSVTVVEWVTSISAVFTQGSAAIYENDSLNDLKQYLVVTASYADGTSAAVSDYTLSGTLTEGTSTITVSYGGKTDTFDVTVSAASLLPAEYRQCEYIKSTGTQYIATDLQVWDKVDSSKSNSLDLYTVDIDFAFDEWQSNYATNIMACFGSNGGKWIGYLNSNQKIGMGTANGNYFTTGTLTDRHQYHYSVSGNTGKWERDDGASISREIVSNIPLNVTFSLFYYTVSSGTQNDFHFNGKLYSCTVYKSGEKVLDLYPCYRKADGEIGLYDTVNSRFYTNDGTGTFEKGSDVT